jgi:hypothetical protein
MAAIGRPGRDGRDGKDGKDGKDGQNGVNGQNGLNGLNGQPGPAGPPINGIFVQTEKAPEPAGGGSWNETPVGEEISLIGSGFGDRICRNVSRGDTYLLRISGDSLRVPDRTLSFNFYLNDTKYGELPVPASTDSRDTWTLEIWYTFGTGPFMGPGTFQSNDVHVTYIQNGGYPIVYHLSLGEISYAGTDVLLDVKINTEVENVLCQCYGIQAVLTKLY